MECLILKVSSSVSSEIVFKKSRKSWDPLSLGAKCDRSVVKSVLRSEGWSLIWLCCLFSVLSTVFQTSIGCLSERALQRKLALVSFITF